MRRLLYTLVYLLALPFMFGRLWWRGRSNPEYRLRWRERLGHYPSPPTSSAVIFHAVSVGEVHAAVPLIEQFLRAQPQTPVVVTTTTPTGSSRVQQLFGERVRHVYLPYDVPGAVSRFFRHFQPQLLVLLETELWPNLLHAAAANSCPVLLVNARLSPKSLASYQRIAKLTQQMLQQLTLVAAQADADGARFVALGLPADRLQVTGSLKYDVAIRHDKVSAAYRLKSQWHGRAVWIAASTREGEDALVLQAFTRALQQLPELLLVLVPRHPERFGTAASEAAAAGLRVQRQTQSLPLTPEVQVLIGDTLGDMQFYYSLADVAFVGGSLVNTGCQNIIEPAALGLPVITGPSLYNFQAASDALCQGGGMKVVPDAEALATAVVALLGDEQARQQMGRNALAVVAANIGATTRLLELLQRYSRSH